MINHQRNHRRRIKVHQTPSKTPGRNTSPGRTQGEIFFGPESRQDWNKINEDDVKYPVRFPAGWDNQEMKSLTNETWPSSTFYDNLLYWSDSPRFQSASEQIAFRHLVRKFAQGSEEYFGQGNFGDLSKEQFFNMTPVKCLIDDYVNYWVNEPWRRVDRYQQLTEDQAKNDLQWEMFEENRDYEETPNIYQKWVERREVREDRPQPSLPNGPPEQKFYRPPEGLFPSSLILDVKDLLLEDEDVETKKSWTIDELVAQTIRRNKVLSRDCSSRFIRSDLKKLVWTYKVTCTGGDSSGHFCRIKILPEYKGTSQTPEDIVGEDFADLHVGVKCTCPAFKFWGPSLNSWSQGYHYGPREDNGAQPRKNIRHKLPLDGVTRRALLCKHIITASKDWAARALKK